MLRHGGGREASWSSLRIRLCRRHKRSGQHTGALVARLPLFHVDAINDQIPFFEELTAHSTT